MATPRRTAFELKGEGPLVQGHVHTAAGGSARSAIVVPGLPGGSSGSRFLDGLVQRLARAGFTVVSFSTDELSALGAVCRRLRSGTLLEGLTRPRALGLFGYSRGGAVAVLYAARDDEVRTLVTWDAPSLLATDAARPEGEVDVVRAAAVVTVPWLIIHGRDDATVPISEGRKLAGAARPGVAVFKTLSNADHTLGVRHPWHESSDQLEEAIEATVEWLVRWL